MAPYEASILAPNLSTPELRILSPLPATVLPADQLEFSWEPLDAALLLTIHPKAPTHAQFSSQALWGYAVPLGAAPTARWADGVSVQGGTSRLCGLPLSNARFCE